MQVVHIISGLGLGGAERMLARLCAEHLGQDLCNPVVISLTDAGVLGPQLRSQGIRVETLGMRGIAGTPLALWRLTQLLRELQPHVVQTWLYHADIIGGLAARAAGIGAVAWNIRCTAFGSSWTTGGLVSIGARLSRTLPASIVCCGEEAARFHAARGYEAGRMVVLPNGFEVDHFTPSQRTEHAGCRFLAIGRDDVLKDYPTLIRAFALLASEDAEASLTICGNGIPQANGALVSELGLTGRVHLSGPLADVREALDKADVYCSSSTNEGFPNVIGEAMLMELPVVATDAGDTALIVGECGQIVPPRNVAELAAAMRVMARMPVAERRALGVKARARIAGNYEIGQVARRYADHYRALAAEGKR